MAENTTPETVTIDGKEYLTRDLSRNARIQLANLQVVDQEIARLKIQMAIAQTARAAYAKVLKDELPQ
jgi:hypothetical protein